MSRAFDAAALEGRVGIVTGAGAGIGRATVYALVAAGATVVAADLDEALGEETARTASGSGRAAFAPVDVGDSASVERMVDEVVERFGRLDFAHNNAGVMEMEKPLAEIADQSWNRMINVDLTGVFYCMRAEVRAILKTGDGGSIVNTSSDLGMVGFAGQAHYVAAKHGVIGLTRAAALDYSAQGIRVNSVCPGVTETSAFETEAKANPDLGAWFTEKHPIGRLGKPSEIADAVVWLVSDASTFVTGQPIAVDGAFSSQ